MKVTYLYQSGFLFELEKHILIFDYYRGNIPILPKHKQVYVFISHRHEDHYNPAIFKKLGYLPDVTYIAHEMVLSPFPYYACKENSTYYIKDIKVTTYPSNDEGVAFLVEVEGKHVYHSGDLHLWNWEPENDNDRTFLIWQKQLFDDAMKQLSKQHLDVACYPIDPRLEHHTLDGIHAFLHDCQADLVIGMHFLDDYETAAQMIASDPILSKQSSLLIYQPQSTIDL